MCYTRIFLCPACGTPSGHTRTTECGRVPCRGIVEDERPMEPDLFEGWFCATRGCGYSQHEQRLALARETATIRAQQLGQRVPDAIPRAANDNVDAHSEDDYGESSSENGEESDVEDEAQMDDDNSRNKKTAPVQGGNNYYSHHHHNNNNRPEPHYTWETWRREFRDAWMFDAETAETVTRLLREIEAETATTASRSRAWLAPESELLLLLREREVTYAEIHRFIPRHSTVGCERHRLTLKKRQQQQQQQQQQGC